jgi:hypothetical protein
MVAEVGYSMAGRSRGWVAPSAVCTVHVEMRSTGFLVKPQNQGRQFVSGLASKPHGRFSPVWPQNQWRWFLAIWPQTGGDGLWWFGLKTYCNGFWRFGLKTYYDSFLWFGLKTSGDGFLQFGLKTGCDGFSRFGLKTGGGFLGCASKPRGWRVSRFGP